MNLTGYSVASKFRSTHDSSTVVGTFTCTISDAANGKITLSMTNSTTSAVEEGIYVYDLEIDTHIAIISKSPAEMLAITHLQEVKNEGYRSNFSYQSYYDNITELSLKLRNEIGVRDNILANGGLALGFKELHCSDAKTLAKILSKNIPGLTLSDTYLTWHKKYKQLNGIEQLLPTNKFKVADKLINDYQDEVDKWLS